MSFQALQPGELLRVLTDAGVEFTIIGALAVNVWSSEIRGTGDVDIMVPAGDDPNKAALAKALKQLDATQLNLEDGGITQGDVEYATLMFQTRFGKLDVLYRPDGSVPYRELKARATRRPVAGRTVQVAGRDDMVRMKTAGGREKDLHDVALMTEAEKGDPVLVLLTMNLAAGTDSNHAIAVTFGRVEMFDEDADVWIEKDGRLKVRARRAGMMPSHIEDWARFLAERLLGTGILKDAVLDIEIVEPEPGRAPRQPQ